MTYVMGRNVGAGRRHRPQHAVPAAPQPQPPPTAARGQEEALLARTYVSRGVSLSGANKGLFLGLLTLVAAAVVVIVFQVVKDDPEFAPDALFWMTSGTLAAVLCAGTLLGCAGLYQVRKLCRNGDRLPALDSLLSTVSAAGVVVYALFGLLAGVVGAVGASPAALATERGPDVMLAAVNALQLVHAAVQSALTAEAYRRSSWSRHQLFTKPGRQVRHLRFSGTRPDHFLFGTSARPLVTVRHCPSFDETTRRI